jgi:hypothetical protein
MNNNGGGFVKKLRFKVLDAAHKLQECIPVVGHTLAD